MLDKKCFKFFWLELYDFFLLLRWNVLIEFFGKIWKLFGLVEEIVMFGLIIGVVLCSIYFGW